MFAFISPVDMMIVVGVALVVFGPKRLPEVARQVGSFVREARSMMSHVTDSLDGLGHEVRSAGFGSPENVMRPRPTLSAPPALPYDQRESFTTGGALSKETQPAAPPVAAPVAHAAGDAPGLRLTDVSTGDSQAASAKASDAGEVWAQRQLNRVDDSSSQSHEANTL